MTRLPELALPDGHGGYSTVYADPPWQFMNKTGKVAPEHRRLHRYRTMTLPEIKELPVGSVATTPAHLYLWCPNALLAEGLEVMKAWGFTYKANIVWHKVRKDGEPDGRGVGFYFRNVTELLLFGTKGHMRTLPPARRMVNILKTVKREHSRKPDEAYHAIEECSPGPYLELFSRHARPGWDVWGDEAPDFVLESTSRGEVVAVDVKGPYKPGAEATERHLRDHQAAAGFVVREP